MRYQIPSLEDMRKKPAELSAAYHKTQRRALIELYDAFALHLSASNISEIDERKLLLAGLIFLEEIIGSEYAWGSAAISSSWWIKPLGGSQLATVLRQLLEPARDNVLGDDERLIYINQLYHYIQQQLGNDASLGNKSKAAWMADLILVLKKLKQRNDDELSALQKSTPALESIRQDIAALTPQYQVATSSSYFWKPSSKRKNSLAFVEFIVQSYSSFYKNIELMSAAEYCQAQEVLSGAVLFSAIRISKEYKVHSPEFKEGWVYNSGSRLFSLYLGALNIKAITEMDPNTQILKLRALSVHLTIVLQGNAHVNIENLELKKIQGKIEDYIREQEELAAQPGFTTQAISASVGLAARHGIPLIMAKVVTTDLVMPLLGRTVFGVLSGPIGLVVFGAGSLMMTGIDWLAQSTVLPQARAGIFAYVINKISKAIGDRVAGAVVATGNGLQALMSHEHLPDDDRILIKEWIKTLLTLPDEIFSKEEKSQIKKIVGVKQDTQPEITNIRILSKKH
ncbi:MAG: hypothetical protein WAW86_09545 [Gammaproteobacteria bacterium]